MKPVATFLHSISDLLDKWIKYLVFCLISAMIIITSLQIICRIFFSALSWSEEATRYLLVWSTFFTATLAYKRGKHIAITFVVESFPNNIKKFIVFLGYVLSLVFFLTVSYYGFSMIRLQVFQISPAMSIPMKHIYLAIPISMIVMSIHAFSFAFKKTEENHKKGDLV